MSRDTGRIALLLSAALHVLLLVVVRFDMPEARTVGSMPAVAGATPVMRVITLRAVTGDVPTLRLEVLRTAPEQRREPAAPRAEPGTETPPGAGPRPSDPRRIRERLAPAVGDPRLWERAAEALPPERERLNVVHDRLRTTAGAYNDSVGAAAEAARRAADWTTTRAYGERWGISPDTIHLGHTRRVLRKCSAGPCAGYLIQPPAGRREAQADLLRTFSETQTQARRAELERAFQERVRALRTRNDSIRAVRRGGG